MVLAMAMDMAMALTMVMAEAMNLNQHRSTQNVVIRVRILSGSRTLAFTANGGFGAKKIERW